MKVFIDTNVVVDYLTMRGEFYKPAAMIFEMTRQKIIESVVSALTIVNCVYVMKKHYDKDDILKKISNFMNILTISSIDYDSLINAINSCPYDFEDAVQYSSSLQEDTDIIITRDKKGFQKFDIEVMSPNEFIASCGIV